MGSPRKPSEAGCVGRSFARQGETEQSGLCDDEVEGKISYETV